MLDWERATAIIAEAKVIAVSLCYCRHSAAHLGRACQTPQEMCLSLGASADYIVRRRFGRAIERSEALGILEQARALHLAQLADNVRKRPAYICNCCGCCCEQLRAVSQFGLPAVNPSGFFAQSEHEQCAGCSRCARACPVGAIEMKPLAMDGRPRAELRPAVDLSRCIGCGVCASACHKRAMRLVRRKERPTVPVDAVEKALRMAIERGRLAHLVFDEGAGRGPRFLNRILAGLLALPPAKQALANEQLRSRFVRFALSRFRESDRVTRPQRFFLLFFGGGGALGAGASGSGHLLLELGEPQAHQVDVRAVHDRPVELVARLLLSCPCRRARARGSRG